MGLNSSGESTPLGTPDARDEGVDDIAAIVASGRMSEYFEKKEREKAVRGRKGELLREAQPQKPNAELNHNTMTLKSGTSILVGGERFRVAETLMEGIIDPPEGAVMGLPDAVTLAVELACRGEHAGKRADLWQHMVIVGGGARVKGIVSNYKTNDRIQRSIHGAFGLEITCPTAWPRQPHPRIIPSVAVWRCRHSHQRRNRSQYPNPWRRWTNWDASAWCYYQSSQNP
jgi:hypothetical protein